MVNAQLNRSEKRAARMTRAAPRSRDLVAVRRIDVIVRGTERDHPAHRRLMVYAVTKAALDRLTTWFAEEMRPHGIAINALSPGGVLTDGWRREARDSSSTISLNRQSSALRSAFSATRRAFRRPAAGSRAQASPALRTGDPGRG